MKDRREASRGAASGARGDPPDTPAAVAERLFAQLTEDAERGRDNGAVPDLPPIGSAGATLEAAAESRRPTHSTSPDPPVAGESEVRDLVVAALAATDRIVEVVEVLGSQTDATANDLAKLGSAIERALTATNERVASLERSVLGEVGAGADETDLAMARLRSVLGRGSKAATEGRKEPRPS